MQKEGFNRQLQGKRALTTTTSIAPNIAAPTIISTSQQSYDQQIQHLAGLTSVLQSEPSYAPNETVLAITTLIALQSDLTTKITALLMYTQISAIQELLETIHYTEQTQD